MLSLSHYFPITDPTLIFFVVLCLILIAPIIMGKLRIPHIIGMVLAGVLIGQYGLNILERDSSFELFGKVGLYYIMFLAGLEIDMQGLKSNGLKVVLFGFLTFFVPFILVFFSCLYFLHYSMLASLMLGSILGSNTLIAYPIVCKYGLQKNSTVTLSVGASMLSLTLALVVLAAIVGTVHNDTGFVYWLLFILKFAIFFAALFYFVPKLIRRFMRKYSDAVMQYIFIMAIMFLSAAVTEILGMEGVFGAFAAGLVLNRYIPHVSPLMNRIEFIGNALFIPYFLIGVGMLINMRILFSGWHIVLIIICLVFFGTLGKAIVAYLMSWFLRLPVVHGSMMFGLTAAHAAGGIAIVMVGLKLKVSEGVFVMTDEMLNGVVLMILFTCVIGSLMTERASQSIVLNESNLVEDEENKGDDEKILIPVKYPETAETLLNMAIMMRNEKLNRGLIGLNVVFDDENRRIWQEKGKALLSRLTDMANAADVRIQTQVRIATNIANGIKHAFTEYQASEIIMGMHIHKDVSKQFWGQFIQSLFNGLNNQIIIVQCSQPLNTLRRIQVMAPARAEFEPGFYRWLERLCRLAENLECRIQFHARHDTMTRISQFISNRHPNARAEYTPLAHWNELPKLASSVNDDELFVVVTARKGTVSYKVAQEKLPDELTRFYSGKNLMIIFPDQFGDSPDAMTFATPQHQEQLSAYHVLMAWLRKKFKV
ncbi:MAG: cation:proton antiporter [Prevotella sp.]|nr:cation:proton antiporter [Prevotella sp.]